MDHKNMTFMSYALQLSKVVLSTVLFLEKMMVLGLNDDGVMVWVLCAPRLIGDAIAFTLIVLEIELMACTVINVTKV